jgi:hypothetical protein
VAAACEQARAQYGEACHFDAGWRPPPLETRIYPRVRPAPSKAANTALRPARPA